MHGHHACVQVCEGMCFPNPCVCCHFYLQHHLISTSVNYRHANQASQGLTKRSASSPKGKGGSNQQVVSFR